MGTSWFEIRLHAHAEGVDLLSALLAEQGYDAAELHETGGGVDVVVYKEGGSLEEAREEASRLVAVLPADTLARETASVAALDESDWSENWREYFPRLTIGRRLEIVPPWEDHRPSAPGRTVVIINPGLAFGTGHHETTRGCLSILDELIRPQTAVADVGCGAGILAIAACKLGAPRVWACDNDPQAVAAARRNAAVNGVADRVEIIRGDGPPGAAPVQERFDVVVANIYAEVLVAMGTALTDCVKNDGVLVLSGIESSRRSLVQDAFAGHGWLVRQALALGEWTTLALRRS